MASLSPPASLLAIIIALLSAECRTHAGGQSRTSSPPTSTSNKHTSNNETTIMKRQRKEISAADYCKAECLQEKSHKAQAKENNLAARIQHSVEGNNKKCLGFSDKEGRYLPLCPCPTKILNVAYMVYSAKEHHYNVSWKPFEATDLKGRNWTHYSLHYRFYNKYNEKEHDMDCVLIPRNKTYFVLKHSPLWSPEPDNEPDKLLLMVVVYPFTRDESTSIELVHFDPSRPTYIPTFIPRNAKVSPSPSKVWVSITGGVIALLFLLLMTYVWQRRRRCRFRSQGPVTDPVRNNSLPNNSAEAAAPRIRPSNPENTNARYYCCYYPENEAFRNDVASTVNRFRTEGYDVIMDAMASSEISSQGPTRWAEVQIKNARKVLVFLSPGLLKLASDGSEGMQSQDVNRVWIELELLREAYVRTRSAAKMVCITLPSAPVQSPHSLLWVKVIYKFPDDYLEILRRLNDRPSIQPHTGS